ncbi:MAG: anaerobic ribonucleoside-triphosphate reductase [Candidatus Eremiobacteraeota bacterium]|nr:anaerobic ribonucleoside-triphosphate reductase [Candidatus Eremiobacteraeota bacterium]
MQKTTASFPILRKRDGRLCKFEKKKITEAIFKALYATGVDSREKAEHLSTIVVKELSRSHAGTLPQVEEIQDMVEKVLIQEGHLSTAKAYILYRAKRTSIREGKSELMDTMEEILKEAHREIPFSSLSPRAKMMKVASAASCNFYLSRIIPSQYADAHRKGEIYIHALEYYSKTADSLQIPLCTLLEKGFSGGYGFLRPPRRYSTIAAHAAIILQSCQNDLHGEQALSDFDSELGHYITSNLAPDEEQCFQAMEGLVYNLNTLYSKVGAQVPQSSISIGLATSQAGRIVAKTLLEALRKGLGRGETPLFPEVIFSVKEGVNFNEGDPNFDLFRLALEVASRRMNPTFSFMDAPFNAASKAAYWGGGSRIAENRAGEVTPRRRGTVAAITINLPRVALFISHKRSEFLLTSFYSELQRVINLAVQQLLLRFETLGHLKAKEMPFVMGEKIYLGSESLNENEEIKPSLRNGTLAIGFVGLAEALLILYGRHHGEDPGVQAHGVEIVEFMKSRVDECAEEHNLNLVLAAPSTERIAAEFALLDRQEFGVVPRITEMPCYSNGFEFPHTAKLTIEQKLSIDGPYHSLCQGGHYSFIKLAAPPRYDEVEKAVRKMKEAGIGFGGISFPLDECRECGALAEKGECPSCGSSRIRKIRRSISRLCPQEFACGGGE